MTTKPLPFPVPLTEKYRPRRLRDFVGLLEVKRTLGPFINAPFEFAWFFLGASGLGKTAIVQAIAEEINAQLAEIPSAECDLDRIQHETALCRYGAFNFTTGKSCDWHVLGIHEADRMTPAAQIALLSKMDSTAWPPKTIFIFTANSKLNLEPRFLSRVKVLEFTNESMQAELPDYLERIYQAEGGKHPLDYQKISKAADYNVRDALNKLQAELLLGTNRKGLPTGDLQILPEHGHECEKCHKPWTCKQLKCKLPHTSVCPTCGGANSVGSLRAKKAWATIRKNIAAEIKGRKKGII
jgi:replication-associated recombination protein RarA